ncbi:hypothetical protein [Mesobacillus foraminis]
MIYLSLFINHLIVHSEASGLFVLLSNYFSNGLYSALDKLHQQGILKDKE